MVAFVLNTNILELQGLQDVLTGAYINNAIVSVDTIETMDGGEAVFPLSGSPITMDYVAGSDGVYRAVLASALPFVAGVCYVAKVDADSGVDRIGHWEFPFIPITRTTR